MTPVNPFIILLMKVTVMLIISKPQPQKAKQIRQSIKLIHIAVIDALVAQ